MINSIWWRAIKNLCFYTFILLPPLTVLLFWSVMLRWIMLVGMDLSPKGMLLKWCMWVYIWCIAVFAWSERWEYRNKETTQNISAFWFNTDTYTARKRNNETTCRETYRTCHIYDDTLVIYTPEWFDWHHYLSFLWSLFFCFRTKLLHLVIQFESTGVLGKLRCGREAGQTK